MLRPMCALPRCEGERELIIVFSYFKLLTDHKKHEYNEETNKAPV